ncbi:hypothetical protein MAR_020623 [Mya arenaria]|uniref:Uncharacterized protein n=1 Tax=Mya arenaria TaxID=6604 RepID=A0ABY7EA17_MYAAR|nr:hypothetical protein MAR_020623 [Mya arenaria]
MFPTVSVHSLPPAICQRSRNDFVYLPQGYMPRRRPRSASNADHPPLKSLIVQLIPATILVDADDLISSGDEGQGAQFDLENKRFIESHTER